MNANVTPISGRGLSHAPLSRETVSVPMPHLKIVPLELLVLHEETDPHRWQQLMGRMAEDGILLNPPVVSETGDGRYMVLDGANRVMALRGLGMTCALVQVVEPTEPLVHLEAWYHLLMYCPADDVLNGMLGLGVAEVRPVGAADVRRALTDEGTFAVIRSVDGRAFEINAGPDSDILSQAPLLRQMVAIYRHRGPFERVATDDMATLREHYPMMKALIIFQAYRHEEIVRLVRAGGRLPTGVTRYIIHGRAMRVRYPLDELKKHDLDEANTRLQSWLAERFASRRVRFYADSMFIFDE